MGGDLVSVVSELRQKYSVFEYAWRTNRSHALDLILSKINECLMPNFVENYNGATAPVEASALLVYKEALYDAGPTVPTLQSTRRQSRWQAEKLIEYFDDLNYRVDVVSHHDPTNCDDVTGYDVIVGQGPNLHRAIQEARADTVTIEYATAMHWSQRNRAIRRDYDRFNRTYGVDFPPRRTVPELDTSERVDGIVVVGDGYARETYECRVDSTPVYNVEASTYDFLESLTDERDFGTARNHFLWMSGSGLVFKGLDLALSVFNNVDDVHLHICAPIEADAGFCDLLEKMLFRSDSIHTHGWVDVGSNQFEELTKRCAYVIAPSVTEGSPGAVIHSMRCGLAPVVTEAVFREVDDWGIRIPSRDIDMLAEVVREAAEMDPTNIEQKARAATARTNEKNSRARFERDLRSALNNIVGPSERTGTGSDSDGSASEPSRYETHDVT